MTRRPNRSPVRAGSRRAVAMLVLSLGCGEAKRDAPADGVTDTAAGHTSTTRPSSTTTPSGTSSSGTVSERPRLGVSYVGVTRAGPRSSRSAS